MISLVQHIMEHSYYKSLCQVLELQMSLIYFLFSGEFEIPMETLRKDITGLEL